MSNDYSPVDPALWTPDEAIHQISIWKCSLDRLAHMIDPGVLQEAQEVLSKARTSIHQWENVKENTKCECLRFIHLDQLA